MLLWLLSCNRRPIDFWGHRPTWIFSEFYKIYWTCYGHQLIFYRLACKNESMAIAGSIYFVKFWKYSCGSMTLKVDESSITTKRSEQHASFYFKNTEKPKAGWGNTTLCGAPIAMYVHLLFPACMCDTQIHGTISQCFLSASETKTTQCNPHCLYPPGYHLRSYSHCCGDCDHDCDCDLEWRARAQRERNTSRVNEWRGKRCGNKPGLSTEARRRRKKGWGTTLEAHSTREAMTIEEQCNWGAHCTI